MKSENSRNAKVGDNVKIRLSNSDEINATIEYIIEEENSKLIIFKISNGLEQLASYRKITLDVIWWDYSGLKVPNNALVKEIATDGESAGKEIYYIIRNRMGYTDKIVVKVLKQNDSYSIITNYTTQELKKQLGYTNDMIKQIKTISLHDEIIINPKVE